MEGPSVCERSTGAQTNGAASGFINASADVHIPSAKPLGEDGGRGRQNRVVLAPVAGVKSAEVLVSPTGLGKTFNPPMTVTRRIRRRGERAISR